MLSITFKFRYNPQVQLDKCSNSIITLSYRFIYINNYDATKIIKSVNTKYKDIRKTDAVDYVLNVFNNIEPNSKDYRSINALLHLFYDWKCPQNLISIWNDIESYHDHNRINNLNNPNKLSYAVLIKCLIQTQEIGIDKCIQTLQWIETYNYKLSIHGSLLNKLVAKCVPNHLQSLQYIYSLIDNHLIEININHSIITTVLINAFGLCGDINNAEKVFDNKEKDNASVGVMMKVYVQNNCYSHAFSFYDKYKNMQNNYVLQRFALKACIKTNDFVKGKEIHSILQQSIDSNNSNNSNTIDDIYIQSTLIDMYGHFQDIQTSEKIFDLIKHYDNIFCINALIKTYICNGYKNKAMILFNKYDNKMDDNDNYLILKTCIDNDNYEVGQYIIDQKHLKNSHNRSIKRILIDFYAKFGDISCAFQIFKSTKDESEFYDKSCASLTDFEKGRTIIYDNKLLNSNNIQIKNSLISFYANGNEIEKAIIIFESINNKDIESFNCIMNGYIDCNMYYECINLFNSINSYNLKYDLSSFIIGIKACSEGRLLHNGERIHNQLKRYKNKWMLHDRSIQTNLINMYAKCSKTKECEQIFDDIKSEENDKYRNDILIWNTMICAYGWSGDLFKVKYIYDLLMEIGVIPNIKTYVSLIDACGDCGHIVFAQKIWNNEIDNNIKHDDDIMRALIKCNDKQRIF